MRPRGGDRRATRRWDPTRRVAPVDDADVVADALDDVHDMGRQHDRAASGPEPIEHPAHRARRHRVDTFERFVEHDQLRPRQHGCCERRLLAHAVAVARNRAVCVVDQVQDGEQLGGTIADRLGVEAAECSDRVDELPGGEAIEELERIEHDAHCPSSGHDVVGDVDAADFDRTCVGSNEADHRSHRRRLAAAVRADQAVTRTVWHVECEVVDCELLAERLRQPGDPKWRRSPIRRGTHRRRQLRAHWGGADRRGAHRGRVGRRQIHDTQSAAGLGIPRAHEFRQPVRGH